jgi:hypothetical protein
MDYDLIFKIATLFLGSVGAGRILYELSIVRRSRMREEYKFAREFLEDIRSQNDFHPFLREKGYQAIAGDSQMSADEIEYLLSLTRPERALRDYVLGKAYLDHFPQSGNLQIKFKKKFEAKWPRQWRMYGYVSLYIICAFIAFSPLILPSYLGMSGSQSLVAFAFSLAVFGPYAWLALRAGSKIYRAQMLVAHQDRHTQKIVLPGTVQRTQNAARARH